MKAQGRVGEAGGCSCWKSVYRKVSVRLAPFLFRSGWLRARTDVQ